MNVWVLDGLIGFGDYFFFQKLLIMFLFFEEIISQVLLIVVVFISYISIIFNIGIIEIIGNSIWVRIVILIERNMKNGENLFIDGGIDYDYRQGI